MIKRVFLLIKINILNAIGAVNKKMATGVFIALMAVLFIVVSTAYNFMLVYSCKSAGVEYISTSAQMCGIASMLTFIYGIASAKGLFASRDYETLRAMPLTKKEIVVGKILLVYIFELMYSAAALIPNAVITAAFSGDVTIFIGVFFAVFFVPALPIALGCFVGLILTLATSKTRVGNVIVMALYILFFIALMCGSAFIGFKTGEEGSSDAFNLGMLTALKYINPTVLLLELAYTSSAAYYAAFVFSNLAVLAVTAVAIAALFDRAYAAISHGNTVKVKEKTLKIKGQFGALFSCEAKRFFSSKVYCVQALISPLMCIVFAITLSTSLSGASQEEAIPAALLGAIMAIMLMFILGIAPPAASSISLEGKNFYIIKSMPVNYKTYARVKIVFYSIVDLVGAIAASIIAFVLGDFNFLECALFSCTVAAYSFGVNALGLNVNMSYYKLNWLSEQEAYKNSACSIIVALVGVGFALISGGISITVGILVGDFIFTLVVMLALSVIYSAVMFVVTVNSADKKIKKITV